MPASPSTARAINDRLALRLLQQEGPLTAGQLKQLTGLSRPTVADLVDRLTAAGLITVVGESGEQRRGPNARLYGIVADRAHLAALDVRTEGVLVLVSDLVGRVLAEASVPIDAGSGTGPAVEQAVAAVESAVKEAGALAAPERAGVREWGRLHTVGIGAPGLIDPATGDLRDSAGLPAWHRSLVATLHERLPGARVTVENETNLAALAEQREGAARDRDTFVLLWLGHGVGAAVVLDGTLRSGASGGTGEIGFLPVPGTDTLPSATDCTGGYHSLTGAAAIVSLATAHGLPAPPTTDGPGAAEAVRGAVTAVLAGMGSGTARSGAGRASAGEAGSCDGPVTREAAGAGARPASAGEPGSPAGSAPAAPAGSGAGSSSGESVGSGAGSSSGESVGSGAGSSSADRPGAGAGPESAVVAGGVAEAVAGPAGELPAARFLGALADRIAVGAASVVAVLDPGCVVLGGEVGQAGGTVLAGLVEERLRRMSPLVTEVRASSLGGTAVLRGALLTARDRAQDELFAPPERLGG
ncbi:ROK family transcriptional regulator [Streptomyces tricolor]|uniref:ROK family transcriptional regulator n=1 Tax=Streptomyces tricolor TaxID=68277 RepID=A0ABS9JFH9_9ACTN|nr:MULTISPECIES: ROK family transcriptional regulator [Streptomyces]MCG0064312.1 ROK family transcriptional regulator [Streptomyces tricolor]BCM71485.1 putative ROK-family transcriptional regulator [Streptomyces sp. EAS-AB2608]